MRPSLWESPKSRFVPKALSNVAEAMESRGHLRPQLGHDVDVVRGQPRPMLLPVAGDRLAAHGMAEGEAAVAAPRERVVLGQVWRQVGGRPHLLVGADAAPHATPPRL
jgi:hypothetical protein